MLGKSRPTRSSQSKRRDKKQEEALPTIDDFLSRRDYEGSLALVDFLRASKQMQAQVTRGLVWQHIRRSWALPARDCLSI